MSVEELQKIKCRDLMKMGTKLGIKGAWNLRKAELIEAILRAEESAEKVTSAKVNNEIDNQDSIGAENQREKQSANVDVDLEGKRRRVEGIEIGALVAFKLSNGKVKSAKVSRKSSKNKKLKVETEYGATYIIAFEDVIWVKSGKRWPRGVYMMLKGMSEEDEKYATV